ncbi:hypothetical protein C8J57DRAFT_1238957 [Mycena rebaudengoi]|nr:hypothetical protein C8J57DRAFT_1238957 [Mycena rebaudengoi]
MNQIAVDTGGNFKLNFSAKTAFFMICSGVFEILIVFAISCQAESLSIGTRVSSFWDFDGGGPKDGKSQRLARLLGVLKKGLKPTTTNQLVAAEDIGHVVFKNPQTYASRILVVAGERRRWQNKREAYKRAPALPSWLARPLIAFNSHTKALIADIERVHDARTSGKCPEVEDQTAAAKQAYPEMKTFEAWVRQRGGKAAARDKDWNQVSMGRLAAGKAVDVEEIVGELEWMPNTARSWYYLRWVQFCGQTSGVHFSQNFPILWISFFYTQTCTATGLPTELSPR